MDYFPFGVMRNNVVMNINVDVFMWAFVIIPVGYIPTSKIAGYVVSLFNFFRNCQTVFHCGCTTLYSHH